MRLEAKLSSARIAAGNGAVARGFGLLRFLRCSLHRQRQGVRIAEQTVVVLRLSEERIGSGRQIHRVRQRPHAGAGLHGIADEFVAGVEHAITIAVHVDRNLCDRGTRIGVNDVGNGQRRAVAGRNRVGQSLALDDEFGGLMLKDLASVVLWRC